MAKRKRKKKPAPAQEPVATEAPEKAGSEAAPEAERAAKAAAAGAYAKQAEAAETAEPDPEPVELSAQDQNYLEMARQAQADLENYKKRVVKEAATRKRDILADFMRQCIPALTDLSRVITEGEKANDYNVLHDGVKLTRDNLWKVFNNMGVVEIEAIGKPFDPHEHEALSMIPSPDHEPNTVIEVFQPGYMYEEFVISPAKVIVAAPA